MVYGGAPWWRVRGEPAKPSKKFVSTSQSVLLAILYVNVLDIDLLHLQMSVDDMPTFT